MRGVDKAAVGLGFVLHVLIGAVPYAVSGLVAPLWGVAVLWMSWLALLVVAVVGLIVAAVALSRFAAQPSWTPLFSNLSGSDASAVVDQLKAQGAQYQLTNGGSTVLVPESQVYDLRVALDGCVG